MAPPRCGPRRCVAPHQSGPPFREDGEGRGGEGAADRKGRGGASSSEGRGREGEAASTFEGRGGDGQVWLRWWEWELGFSDEFLYILELVVGWYGLVGWDLFTEAVELECPPRLMIF